MLPWASAWQGSIWSTYVATGDRQNVYALSDPMRSVKFQASDLRQFVNLCWVIYLSASVSVSAESLAKLSVSASAESHFLTFGLVSVSAETRN